MKNWTWFVNLQLIVFVILCPVSRSSARDDPTLVKERGSTKISDEGLGLIGLSPDDRYLWIRTSGEALKLWDLKEQKEAGSLNCSKDFVRRAVFSPDAKTLATMSTETPIKLWEVPTLKLLGNLGEKEPELGDKEIRPLSLAYSPDGKLLACGGVLRNGKGFLTRIKVWNIESAKEIATFRPPDKWGTRCLLFTKDGKTVVSGGDDSMIRFWDIESGKEVDACKVDENPVTAIAITKDGKRLVTAGLDEIFLWDLEARKKVDDLLNKPLLRQMARTFPAVDSLAFTPDGKVLAVPKGGDQDNVVLFDTDVGKIKSRLTGHKKGRSSQAVAITSDGKTIISAGADGTIKLWDMPD
jgi:WD40 repeat protein